VSGRQALRLELLPGRFAVARLPSDAPAPSWAASDGLHSITRTPQELSVVCAEAAVPPGVRHESGFRALRVAGSLDFQLVGILLSLAQPLAEAGISMFSLSTFDTDYVLVRERDLDRAVAALAAAGHSVATLPPEPGKPDGGPAVATVTRGSPDK
jgi:hypothetical protein